MRAELLHVVTAISNPVLWRSRDRLLRQFVQHMLDSGVNLTLVECQLGERPFQFAGLPHINHVGTRHHTLVWHKENLLNLGFARLPAEARYLAWIDADVMFRRADWAAATVHALQQYAIVQPWQDCYDLGPHGEHLEAHKSFLSLVHHGATIMQGPRASGAPYRFGHPGYAWAATRAALNALGGLIDTAALGAGDHHMALALIGRVGDTIPNTLTQGYKAPLYSWQTRAARFINQSVGYLPGTIEHQYHGDKAGRSYIGRWEILAKWRFDPATDLVRNLWNVYELTGNKPGLTRAIDRYFRSRQEDATTITAELSWQARHHV